MIVKIDDGLFRQASVITESVAPCSDSESPIVLLRQGRKFYNAIKTSGDIVIYEGDEYKNMIQLYSELIGISKNKLNCCNSKCKGESHHMVGAHVVTDASRIDPQIGDIMYIIPLCRACNPSKSPVFLKQDTLALKLVWLGKGNKI